MTSHNKDYAKYECSKCLRKYKSQGMIFIHAINGCDQNVA